MDARRASTDPGERERLTVVLAEALEELVMWTRYGKTTQRVSLRRM